jgi:DNA-binding response OmpR family regulator
MTAPRLLLVDDDSDFAGALTIALELEGYKVDMVSNGQDGIAAAQGTPYDAVLIDIGLPGLNGVETLRQIRQVSPRTRCFLITGHSEDDLLEQGINAGAVEIFTKPIDLEEILRHLTAGQ